MNMRKWIEDIIASPVKNPLPVLSFPSISLMGVGVRELIADSGTQAKGMKLIADRIPSAASVSMMDLSVEAEAFGSEIRFSDSEVPTVIGRIIETQEQAEALSVPEVGAGRTGLYVEAIGRAAGLITDRPVLAGVIGPFSLAGRLLDVSEAMLLCYDEPELVAAVLEKAAAFITEYIKAYKTAGANGVVMAEPLAGLLSPDLNREFSTPYVRRIVEAVQDDSFAVCYHNCGGGTPYMLEDILSTGAMALHFGNAVDMAAILPQIPEDVLVMGNIDPAGVIRGGTPALVRERVLELLGRCSGHPNYLLSSGCDIPPATSWENIDAFFAASEEFYASRQ